MAQVYVIGRITADLELKTSEKKNPYTPNIHTIEEVCEFLHCDEKTSCKAVVY